MRRGLDAAGLNHRPVLLAVDTDVTLDGVPAREWLVVTPDHLTVAHDDAVERCVAWTDVRNVRTAAGVGGYYLWKSN